MRYGLALSYVTSRTGGFTNLLIITLCNLIPVVGPIATLGYRAEVSQALLRDRQRRRHPKFDFDRFGKYLNRGVWAFLQSLLLGVILAGCVLVSAVVGFAVATIQAEAGMIVGFIGYAGSILAVTALAAPMQFHAELSNKFDFLGSLKFAWSAWSTVGLQMFLTWLVFIPISFLVAIAGLLLCFVGIYPASVLLQMASQHLMVQLYDEYLDRGGQPIREFRDPEEYEQDDDYDDDEDEEEDDRPRRRRRSDDFDDE